MLTWFAVDGRVDFATIRIGAWTAAPSHGTADADPYARATFAKFGTLPLSLADGLVFIARRDSAKKPLDGRCTIRIAGRVPQSRFWTMTVTDDSGALIDNPAGRFAFVSSELVWNSDGRVEIVAAPRARAGNWLPTGGASSVVLVLRLYDTQTGFASRTSDAPLLPVIRQDDCP
ncbi:hypothetical protein BVIRIDIS_18280 [Blastochloris viridis]|uniref:DUF1214 domain-containing protein n=1 Tax=Blastochloris viridis TaxID=1079 RepID=A0A0S4Q5M2_BLAVI|nr:hypothetical protein BVIRIDIS_18280 [Blastochloris viridis]